MKKLLLVSLSVLAGQVALASTVTQKAVQCTLDGNQTVAAEVVEVKPPNDPSRIYVYLKSDSIYSGYVPLMYKDIDGTIKTMSSELSYQQVSGKKVNSKIKEHNARVKSEITLDQDEKTIKSISLSRQFYDFGIFRAEKDQVECQF